jgi:hypothetical protein
LIENFLAPITNPNAPANSNGIAPNTKPTATATVIAFPATGAANSSPGYLDQLRQEIKKLQSEHATQNQNVGWFKKTNLEFAPQSLAFFLAHGMVITAEAWEASGGDPLKMEKHIHSLKDPVAQLSMYVFMQATGFYVHFNAKRLNAKIDDLTRMRMMRRFSYQGLAFGSLVSSLVSDIFSPISTCLKAQFNSDKRFIKKYVNECIMGLTSAWSNWTLKKKINQYTPQIFSAIVGQGVSELIEIGAVSFGQAVSKKISWQTIAAFSLKKEFFTVRKIAVNVGSLIAPGIGQAKVFTFLGSVIKAVNFIGTGIILTPYLYRPFNNILLPFEFNFDATNMNHYLNQANRFNWDTQNIKISAQQIQLKNKTITDTKELLILKKLNYAETQKGLQLKENNKNINFNNPNIEKLYFSNNNFEKLPGEIDNFTEAAQAWKSHLNMQNEESLANWLEYSKKILNQIGLAHKFYKTYIENFYNSLSIGNQIKNGQTTAENKFNNNYFPFRLFPLYGVGYLQSNFSAHQSTEKHLLDTSNKENSSNADNKPDKNKILISDIYLDTPQHMEKYQLQTIAYALKKIKKKKIELEKAEVSSNRLVLSPQAENLFQNITDLLATENIEKISQGLVKINMILEIYGTPSKEYQFKNTEPVFFELINLLRLTIGNPYPILVPGAGFSQAFNLHSTTKELSTNSAYPLKGPTYDFNKDSDFFTYQMICGPFLGKLTENSFMSDNFLPPTVLKEGSKPLQICNTNSTLVRSSNLYSIQLNNETDVKDKSLRESKNFNITNYLVEFFDYAAFGDFRSSTPKFETWWSQNVNESTRLRIHKMDEDYAKIVTKTYDSIYGTSYGVDTKMSAIGYALTTAADWLNFSKYLPKNIDLTLKWQLEVYLDILQALYDNSMSAENKLKNFNYLELARTNAEFPNKRQEIFINKSQLIEKLREVFNQYFIQMQPDFQLNLEDHLNLSKKITSLINDIKIQSKIAEQDNDKSTDTQTILATTAPNAADQFDLKQKIAQSALNGLVLLEADIKRFIRLKIQLSSSLDIEIEEFNKMRDGTNEQKPKKQGYIPGQSH